MAKKQQPQNEPEVIANVSPRSKGTVSLYETAEPITSDNVERFRSEQDVIANTVRELRREGFAILQVSDTTISIGGSRKLFQDVFNTKLKKDKKEVIKGQETVDFYTAMGAEDKPEEYLYAPDKLSNLIEGVSLAVPPELFESAIPPLAQPGAGTYRYLFVPDDVAVLLNAARVHRLGTTGKGIRVAMVDTGHYFHPFFNLHGFRVQRPTVLGPGAGNPSQDLNGHGTGESANVFATAPDATLIPVKMAADATGAFNAAIAQNPHVITNSWGYNVDTPGSSLPGWLAPLAAAVSSAVANGIVVCFAAGNGHFGFPGSHPDVISVGGVHVNTPWSSSSDFEASSYASSFQSSFYPGRNVPDVCGLVGKNVGGTAPLVMLPVQPGSGLDLSNTGATNDGWGIFSGTSAACPQVAGIVALLLQKKPSLTPAQVKDKLMKMATDVKSGTTAMGDAAGPGVDLATGAGLVNAKWSWLITMGAVTAEFFAASEEVQHRMLTDGQMPEITSDLIDELVTTLRTVR